MYVLNIIEYIKLLKIKKIKNIKNNFISKQFLQKKKIIL
jgi:hypothetical protein